jgi:hypothetical protein
MAQPVREHSIKVKHDDTTYIALSYKPVLRTAQETSHPRVMIKYWAFSLKPHACSCPCARASPPSR